MLAHGRIIEQGNHDELIELRGAYYNLYSLAFESHPNAGAPAAGEAGG